MREREKHSGWDWRVSHSLSLPSSSLLAGSSQKKRKMGHQAHVIWEPEGVVGI